MRNEDIIYFIIIAQLLYIPCVYYLLKEEKGQVKEIA